MSSLLLNHDRYRPATSHLGLGEAFFDLATPANFPKTQVRYRNARWSGRLGFEGLNNEAWARHFGRFAPLPDNLAQPLALKYHGHQFQHYNPDLGDGRGFLYAQLHDPDDGRLLDFGTKGSGTTNYSRAGDGRLTLKGGVREVLATAQLEALGVYTSKTFSLIETGEQLMRGDEPSPTRSAVLVRLNHSHIRFGTFQRLAFDEDHANMARLIAYTLEAYYGQEPAGDVGKQAEQLFDLVVSRTARLAAQWFAAGFVHGVLNTDNMNITGESFDYGPYRFLPYFDPEFTAAYFDHSKLYAFGRQPQALSWNLQRLAQTLLLVDASTDALTESLRRFAPLFDELATGQVLWRLGLSPGTEEDNRAVVKAALAVLTDAQSEPIGYDDFFFYFRGRRTSPRHSSAAIDDFLSKREALAAVEEKPGGYFDREQPVRLLYDDIEQLWGDIAQRDDWTAFEQKLRDIEQLRQAM